MSAALHSVDLDTPISYVPVCPTCDKLFSAEPGANPHSLSCGHSVCGDCAGAMTSLSPPLCLICRTEVDPCCTGNDALLDLVARSETAVTSDESLLPALQPGVILHHVLTILVL